MKKTHKVYFRVDTPAFLKEIANNALAVANMGVLKHPLNIFQRLLAVTANRAAELNDPILNQCMFDLNLYELPEPTSKEYGELMKQVYAEAEKQRIKESIDFHAPTPKRNKVSNLKHVTKLKP